MAFKTIWNEENIRSALERFKSENGRYPSAREFDKTSYLPTARQIQRKFGGLPALRTSLKLTGDTDLTKGTARSKTAAKTYARSYIYEEDFYNFLTSYVREEYVHEQKRIRPGNIACDFFVYNIANKSSSIVIDVFYAETLYNLAGIVNIKLKRYVNVPYRTYFICVGKKVPQKDINILMNNKKTKLPDNIKVCNEEWFRDNFLSLID